MVSTKFPNEKKKRKPFDFSVMKRGELGGRINLFTRMAYRNKNNLK